MVQHLVADIYSVYWREMKHYIKEKSILFMAVLQPIVWLCLMGNSMNGLTSNPYTASMLGGAPDYLTYMAPGMMIMTALFSGLYGGVSLLSDRRFGYMTKLLSSPIHRASIPLGKALSITTQSVLQVFIIVLFSLALGVRFETHIGGIVVMLLISALFCEIMVCLSLMLSLKLQSHQAIYALVSFVSMPLTFTSNAMFPRSVMPAWLSAIAKFNPLTYAVNAVRELTVTGWSTTVVLGNVGVLFVLAVVVTVILLRMFKHSVQ